MDGWPEPQTNQVDCQANLKTEFGLNPALGNILSSIESSGILAFLQQQQTEAIANMGIIPGGHIPTNFSPPQYQLQQGPIHNWKPHMQQPRTAKQLYNPGVTYYTMEELE